MNTYKFKVKLKDGKMRIVKTISMSLNGAIRKVFQSYEIERFVRIL